MAFTIKNLRETIDQYNQYQIESGSIYFFREQGRNGYQAVDVMSIDPDGSISCQSNLEGGSSRHCADAIYKARIEGYTYPQKQKELTRAQALTALKLIGFTFEFQDDFTQFGSRNLGVLHDWARYTKYRKPRNANGSTGRYFFNNLVKLQKRIGS